jgi:ArsR family transcriptional regulator, lead/cadmium/zinc/bismuth-responsive transcriptional repressor
MSTRAYVRATRAAGAARPVPREAAFVDGERVRRVQRALVSPEDALILAETFSLLGDPTRTRILHALSVDELCVSDLATLLGLSPSAVSHQLRLLRDRRLVAVRRDGKRTYYSLQDEHIRTLVDMGTSHAAEDARARHAHGPGRKVSR